MNARRLLPRLALLLLLAAAVGWAAFHRDQINLTTLDAWLSSLGLTEPARVAAGDARQIEALPHQRHDQPRQVVLRHIVLHARPSCTAS